MSFGNGPSDPSGVKKQMAAICAGPLESKPRTVKTSLDELASDTHRVLDLSMALHESVINDDGRITGTKQPEMIDGGALVNRIVDIDDSCKSTISILEEVLNNIR